VAWGCATESCTISNLGRLGGTPGKHAAVWRSQLWHGIGQRRTTLLVLGPRSVHMDAEQLGWSDQALRQSGTAHGRTGSKGEAAVPNGRSGAGGRRFVSHSIIKEKVLKYQRLY
jgi:hypothetical protein